MPLQFCDFRFGLWQGSSHGIQRSKLSLKSLISLGLGLCLKLTLAPCALVATKFGGLIGGLVVVAPTKFGGSSAASHGCATYSGSSDGPFDAQFFHSPAQGVGMQIERFGCAAFAFDDPAGLFQHGQNVAALNIVNG